MKAKDLMIGDWVAVHRPGDRHEQLRVKSVIGNGTIEAKTSDGLVVIGELAVEPIPLTAEMLEKNFADTDEDDGVSWKQNGDWYEVEIVNDAENEKLRRKFRYVHELQHALRLAGIDKEIEL